MRLSRYATERGMVAESWLESTCFLIFLAVRNLERGGIWCIFVFIKTLCRDGAGVMRGRRCGGYVVDIKQDKI